MTPEYQTVPAASFSLEAYADIFTRSFEGYFYPALTTAESLAARIRAEQIDLFRSVVLLEDGRPVAQGVLAIRNQRAWCGGFGVMADWRGKGLSSLLIRALIDQARQAGAHEFSLEVLTRNVAAIRTYTGGGLQIIRDLHIFGWDAANSTPIPIERSVYAAEPAALLPNFRRLHPVPAAWQRDLPALLVAQNLHSIAVGDSNAPAGYVLYRQNNDAAQIVDVAATRVEDAVALLAHMQSHFKRITSINEPANSPNSVAYVRCGFTENDRQHEMALDLTI